MKANAPEKLYVALFKGEFNVSCSPTNNTVEYIRTDAFIHKACEWLRENKDKYLYNTGEKGEYVSTCSGKMIDDFKNYMKEE